MLISCVLTECVTQRSSGLLVTKLCQVSPSLNVANVHLVLLGTQAVGEGAQLPGGQLAHFWGQIHEGHIPTGTSVSAATQNTLFQMDDLWHQQHNKIPGGIGLKTLFKLPSKSSLDTPLKSPVVQVRSRSGLVYVFQVCCYGLDNIHFIFYF